MYWLYVYEKIIYNKFIQLLLRPSRGAKYCNVFVCMYVCPVSCLKNNMSKFHEIFCTCYLWYLLTIVRYVIHFWFCGWRHVSIRASLIMAYSLHYVKTWRHPQHRKYITGWPSHATGNVHRQFDLIWTRGFWDMRADRQTDGQTEKQTHWSQYFPNRLILGNVQRLCPPKRLAAIPESFLVWINNVKTGYLNHPVVRRTCRVAVLCPPCLSTAAAVRCCRRRRVLLVLRHPSSTPPNSLLTPAPPPSRLSCRLRRRPSTVPAAPPACPCGRRCG